VKPPRLLARLLVLVSVLAVPVACSDGPSESAGETTTTTSSAIETTTAPDELDGAAFVDTLTFLAEEGDGRDNLSEGSSTVQARLVEELELIAEPVPGGDGFLHPFDEGTNVIGTIEGTTAPSEVVVLGAHYDHLGHDCPTDDPGDEVCDGAGDNAAGVAAVLEIGRRLAADPPARSVILALWDAEEDDRLGSVAAVQSGVLDIDSVVAYLNWDMQGINLLPSLVDTTLVIGAETGGSALEDAVASATRTTDLQPVDLSVLFGQGRSDHASFVEVGVPSVFFTDATSACYHTAQDDMEHLDLEKLARQIDFGETVARAVAGTDAAATFVPDAPIVSFDDAEELQAMVERVQADLDRYPAEDQADVEQFLAALDAMVEDGEAAFDDDDADTLFAGTASLVELFTEGDCDGFLD
jgi:Zn-dependent M28 family amino/carboxypeptidase